MAKSLRSKSERKSKAARYARVYKPVDEARCARLSAKLYSDVMETENDPEKTAAVQEIIRQKRQALLESKSYKNKLQSLFSDRKQKKNSREAKRIEKEMKVYDDFDGYGLSKRELRF